MPSTLAPIRLDAGRSAVRSRVFEHPSFDGRIHCLRAFRRPVAGPPYLVGYCRWDGRPGRMTPPDNHTCDFHVAPIRDSRLRGSGTAATSMRSGTSVLVVRNRVLCCFVCHTAGVLIPAQPNVAVCNLTKRRRCAIGDIISQHFSICRLIHIGENDTGSGDGSF
jgi:hypothetical protein